LAKLQRSLAKRGIGGTLRAAVAYALEPLAPYRPSRLAKRWADWRYDRIYGVDTSSTMDLDSLQVTGPSRASGKRYQATTDRAFRRVLESVPIDHMNFTFVDFGSGKGKCLLMAADYPFRKIVGVEFSSELVEIARRNVKIYRSPRQKCHDIESLACDAAAFDLPPVPCVLYFYNPFGPDILQRVRDNLERSLKATPRPAYVLYYNPVHREVFDQAPWLSLIGESPDWCTYFARPEQAQ
jgi:predicted RNA methylase